VKRLVDLVFYVIMREVVMTADGFVAVLCKKRGGGVGSLSFRLSPCPASAPFLSKEGTEVFEVLNTKTAFGNWRALRGGLKRRQRGAAQPARRVTASLA